MSRPTPIQSTKTTHSSSFRVSRTPMSSTRPKPIVDTEAKQRRCSLIFQGTGKVGKRYHPEGVLMTTQTLVGTYHRARYWAVPEKQGHPWPTGPWSVSCSGSCGRLSVVTWTSKASATGRIQSPFVWNGAAVEGTYSALLLPCDVQHHAYWGRRCFAAKWSAAWCWRSGWKSMWNKGGKDKNGGLRRRKTGWTAVHIHFHLEINVMQYFGIIILSPDVLFPFWNVIYVHFVVESISQTTAVGGHYLLCLLKEESTWFELTAFWKYTHSHNMLLLLSGRDSAFLLLAACCVIKISFFFPLISSDNFLD